MCTGILITTKNGNYIFGRTLEFGMYFIWQQVCNDKMIATVGRLPNSNKEYMTDGLNKDGLLVGTFFFPHHNTDYSKVERKGFINIKSGDVTKYLLENFTSVNSIKSVLPKINIIETLVDNIPFSMHWIICDKKGNCGVLEVKNKQLLFYNNPYHVITNSPEFPQHIKNIEKFSFLSPYNKPNTLSEGSGAIGLPGDNTSQSRFIRAHFYKENTPITKNSKIGMETLFRLLHNFDIPLGSVIDKKTNEKEITEYTVCYDINNFCMEYANYGYIKNKNGHWKQTRTPVNKCINYMSITKNLLIILIIISIISFCKKCNK